MQDVNLIKKKLNTVYQRLVKQLVALGGGTDVGGRTGIGHAD